MNKIKIGSDNFPSLRKGGFYYVDKSMFIKEILESSGQVNLITRPRRFGKSLNMSMLKAYLEIGADPGIFKGLAIEGEKEIHDKHFGKHPVLHMSLAGINGENFNDCIKDLAHVLSGASLNLLLTLDSEKIDIHNKQNIEKLISSVENPDLAVLKAGLENLTSALYYYYGKEIVILIDDYDSIVTHAIGKGHEKRILEFLSGFFGNVFKGNDQVDFVVLTGRLRIANESIFSGANNLKVTSVSDSQYSSCFGLSDEDAARVLDDFGLSGSMETFREWYDGYLIGSKRIFNISSFLSYCGDLMSNPGQEPKYYWANSSSNDIITYIISKSETDDMLPDLEKLLLGEAVTVDLRENICLDDFNHISTLWSILVHYGYLTPKEAGSKEYRIPNKEVRYEFLNKVVRSISQNLFYGT
ncbi:MAG: AAA family ATPase [Clostridiales bacterium]|jgi:hypothetical protein|nr:AAA family ATPase [Clostridiales bacterium]